MKGKQFGIGIYTVADKAEDGTTSGQMKSKHGLWEDGKRILWFEPEQVDAINRGQQDFRDFLRQQESGAIVERDETFLHPRNF